jgi:hypothetical protein
MAYSEIEGDGGAGNGALPQGMNGVAATDPGAAEEHAETDHGAGPAPELSTPQPASVSLAQAANGAAQPAAASEAPEGTNPAEIGVRDIRKGKTDCRGEKIDYVFFRRRDYVIYRSGGKILVHYSDNETTLRDQVAHTAELLPLRNRLQYLMKDMTAPTAYHWQIAEAFRLGLDGQRDAAKSIMQGAIDDIVAKRVSKGRTAYLFCTGAAAGLVACCAGAAAMWFLEDAVQPFTAPSFLMMATGSGALGALLSTAIALRARTVATDYNLISNAVDSTIRILIGVISAAVLYLILDSNLLQGLHLGSNSEKPWNLALLAGFLAGFVERLVPDLLENKLAPAMAK